MESMSDVLELGKSSSNRLGEIVRVPADLGQGLFTLAGKKFVRYGISVDSSDIDKEFASLSLPTLADKFGQNIDVVYQYNGQYYGQIGNLVIKVDFTKKSLEVIHTISEAATPNVNIASKSSINPNTGRIAFLSRSDRQKVIFTKVGDYTEHKVDFGNLANTASGSMNSIIYVCDNTWVAKGGSSRVYISRDDCLTWSAGQYMSGTSDASAITYDASYIYLLDRYGVLFRVSRYSGHSWSSVKNFAVNMSAQFLLYNAGSRKFFSSSTELIYTDNNLNSFTKVTIPKDVQQGVGGSYNYVTARGGIIELWQRDNANNKTHIYNVNPTSLAITYLKTVSELAHYGSGAHILLPSGVDFIYGSGSQGIGFYQLKDKVKFIKNDDSNIDDAIIVG